MAATGTCVRAFTVPTLRKNSPSSAIAKYTRGAVRMDWLRNPTLDTAIASAMNFTPGAPSATRITDVAGTVVAASPSGPSARRQTMFTETYSAITPATPISSARDRFRRGSLISPATKLAVCHPPYANSTGTIAAPKSLSCPHEPPCSSRLSRIECGARTRNNPAVTSIAMATILATISTLCTRLPIFTPMQLIQVRITNATSAIARSDACRPVSSTK